MAYLNPSKPLCSGTSRLGRRIDDDEVETSCPRLLDVLWQIFEAACEEDGSLGLPAVPPPSETSLRVGVDHYDRPLPCPLGLHCEVARQGRLTGASLLGYGRHTSAE